MPETPRYGELDIDLEPGDGQILIRVKGEVDLSNAARIEEAINSACGEKPTRPIVLDLCHLEFIDSTGLSVLVQATRRSRENGNRLQVRGAGGQVRRILEIAGVYEWLLQEGDSDDATG